ncbi:hypothetical protein CcCBS67573_g07018 [Chytriomyces confervae]|uniref:Uncharacterized protein n=1 Tax=Chytriomyces confervae TaxID=246404 RepID=A0A507EY98_9FUNG|nr:hypothetical protein CcCBS67573_g07018 [Chytriomyces confervae]
MLFLQRRLQSTSAQTRSQIASITSKLAQLSGNGTAQTAFGDSVRVTVVGDVFSKRDALVNILLENSHQPNVIEAQTTPFLQSGQNPVTIKYAQEFSRSDGAVSLPLDWLQNCNTEVVSLPASAPISLLTETIDESDITLLVTNANAPLASKDDTQFIELFGNKPNLYVAPNTSTAHDSTGSTSDLAEYISSRIANLSDSSVAPKVFPINTFEASAALANTDSPKFSQHWAKSGIQDLKTQILKSISGDERVNLQTATAAYNAKLVASRLHQDTQNAIELMEAVSKNRVVNGLEKGLALEEERLRNGFVQTDLSGVGEKVGGLLASLREYLGGIGVFGLVFRGDSLSKDLDARIRGHSLIQAEYRMTYAIGRLNEALYTLYARTRAELGSLASAKHPLSAYSATKDLQSDVSRIIDILDKQAPSVNPKKSVGGVEADTFVLRNVVATGFDVSAHVEEIQGRASQIVRSLFGSQILFACGGTFATYLGVPWAISIPSTVLVSGVGAVFYHFRWSAAQDKFISKIAEAQKTLESKLVDAYNKEFTRVLSDPLALIVKMLSSAVEKRVVDAKKTQAEVETLLKEIEEVTPK